MRTPKSLLPAFLLAVLPPAEAAGYDASLPANQAIGEHLVLEAKGSISVPAVQIFSRDHRLQLELSGGPPMLALDFSRLPLARGNAEHWRRLMKAFGREAVAADDRPTIVLYTMPAICDMCEGVIAGFKAKLRKEWPGEVRVLTVALRPE